MRKSYTGFPLDKPDPGMPGAVKIWVPMLWVRCSYQHQTTPSLPAIVDSGSPYCLFRTEVANFLHIDLVKAPKGSIGGVISDVHDDLFFHRMRLQIENNWTIDIMAAFMKKLSVPAILGRTGFFDRFQVTFDHSTSPPEVEIDKIDSSTKENMHINR